jgi:hypothetical protein
MFWIWSLVLVLLCMPLIYFVKSRLPPSPTPPPCQPISYCWFVLGLGREERDIEIGSIWGKSWMEELSAGFGIDKANERLCGVLLKGICS